MSEKLHPVCHGWNEHSDADLARFCRELTGEEVQVVPEAGSFSDP
jgi:hypothetical protein